MVNRTKVKIRQDLQEQELGVPVGNFYLFGNEYLESRWINEDQEDETFQVFYRGQWLDAVSIDWELVEVVN